MSQYQPTIGLEIHAELNTLTKMFCDSANDAEEGRPNVNVCPVCLAHPGTLPAINKEAVRHVLRVGKALDGELADFTEFDRKNYFYPDIPKGYQISQYAYPLVSGGELADTAITRVHLEEDTGTSLHDRGDHTLLDFNRAGVPLMELVTEPVMENAEQAGRFARELQLLLRTLGASEANMEKGQMRVEANISISDSKEYGTKVEVKNLNSFRAVESAIVHELDRQRQVLEGGDSVVQETRGWDEHRGETFSQRAKETADDYRYFPDPDLPKLKISEIPDFQGLELPELPWQKRERLQRDYRLSAEPAEMFVRHAGYCRLFEAAAECFGGDQEKIKLASNYLTSDVAGLAKNQPDVDFVQNISPERFAMLIEMTSSGELSSRGAKDTLAEMFTTGGDPNKIAQDQGLLQQNDESELEAVVQQVIAENPGPVEEFQDGKEASLKFLIGQGMKATGGSANPQTLDQLFRDKLS